MTKHLMISAAAVAMTAFAASQASATAVYTADTTTALTLLNVSNTTGSGDSELQFAMSTNLAEESSDTSGDASADTDSTLVPNSDGDSFGVIQNSFAVGETLSNSASVSGSAVDGMSSANVFTDADMFVENLSLTDTFEISFELTYDMFASAMTDGMDGESASAESFVQVTTELFDGVTGTIEQDGVISEILSGIVLELALDPSAGDGDMSESASILLTFVLEPLSAVNMFMFADALGNATGVAMMDADAVPLPGALGFMVVGAAGLAGLRKRKAA